MRAERLGELLDASALDLQARRRAVAAEATQVPSTGGETPEQVESVDAAPRALADIPGSSAISTTGRRWRSASREATIPITPACQSSPAST